MKNKDLKLRYIKQQKIHLSLEKLFYLLEQPNNINFVVKYIDEINEQKYDVKGSSFFIMNRPKNKIKNIETQLLGGYKYQYFTKLKLYDILFDILNTNSIPISIIKNDFFQAVIY